LSSLIVTILTVDAARAVTVAVVAVAVFLPLLSYNLGGRREAKTRGSDRRDRFRWRSVGK
jgi:hypothetical protein